MKNHPRDDCDRPEAGEEAAVVSTQPTADEGQYRGVRFVDWYRAHS
jgi:hypothetical protein